MSEQELNQWLIPTNICSGLLQSCIDSFITDRKIQNLAYGTIMFYKAKLGVFVKYCELIKVDNIFLLTPSIIRNFLEYLANKGHNQGGIHAFYRAIKTFLLWWESETEPVDWTNPVLKVKAPKLSIEPIKPVSIDTVKHLISTCSGSDILSLRDKALFLFLLDTGARASEVCAINIEDVDLLSGAVIIKNGKGRKPRVVFFAQKMREALQAYIKIRTKVFGLKMDAPLWITKDGERLTYWGLNQMLRRRSLQPKIEKPYLHDFRRAFALNFLRNGGDIYTLKDLMGHSDLQVMIRYLALVTEDLQKAHKKFSPVDRSSLYEH